MRAFDPPGPSLKPACAGRVLTSDTDGARPPQGLGLRMSTNLSEGDRVLLDRYIESVLLRFSDGRIHLGEATEELAQTMVRAARGGGDLLDHMRGLVEAGDDA